MRIGYLYHLLIDPRGRHATAYERKLTHCCIFITLLATAGFLWTMWQNLAPAMSQRSLRSVKDRVPQAACTVSARNG
jgi:hypothetical protein